MPALKFSAHSAVNAATFLPAFSLQQAFSLQPAFSPLPVFSLQQVFPFFARTPNRAMEVSTD